MCDTELRSLLCSHWCEITAYDVKLCSSLFALVSSCRETSKSTDCCDQKVEAGSTVSKKVCGICCCQLLDCRGASLKMDGNGCAFATQNCSR